jgi:hypothetical protein
MASRHGIAAVLILFACAAHAQGEAPEEPEDAPVELPAAPNDFLKRYQAAERSFSLEGTARGMASLEALAADTSLNPAQSALVQSRLGARYGHMNERNRANRHMANARDARKAATPEQVAALGVDLDARMLLDEALFEARKGNTLEAARLQRLAERRIWENVRLLSGDKSSPAYIQARTTWMATVVDSVQFNIRAGRLSEYRDYAKSLGEDSTGLPARSRSRAAAAQARALLAAGDHEGALAHADRALKLHAEARELDSGLTVQTSRSTRVIALVSLERFDECAADSQIALAQFSDRAVAGAFSLLAAKGFDAACRRDFGAAEQFANEGLEYRLKVYGREHYLTKESTGQVLFFRLQHSDLQGSVGAIASLVDRVAGSSKQWADAQESPQHSVRPVMTKVLDGIHAMVAAGRKPDAQLAELGFRITEYMKLSASQGALLDGAAKLAAKTPELRELVEREQALKAERAAAITRTYRAGTTLEKTQKGEKVDRDQLAKQQKALKAAEAKLSESENALDNVRRELSQRFPEYREMVNPVPLTLDETRALLRNGEVYVSQYATARSGLVWIVDRSGLVRVLPSASRAETSALAARYRSGIDSFDAAGRAPDLPAGTKLREALLGDGSAVPTAARTLIVSTDPVLSSVPLQALPMADKTWVTQRWAVASLPGATSLKLLRGKRGGDAGAPLAAFGDPAFSPAASRPPRACARCCARSRPPSITRASRRCPRRATRWSRSPRRCARMAREACSLDAKRRAAPCSARSSTTGRCSSSRHTA